MTERRVNKALDSLDRTADGDSRWRILTFEEYLGLVKTNPELHLRNVFQTFSDMFRDYIGEGENEYPDDPENIGYVRYDCSRLFAEGADNPFFADRLFANRLVNLAKGLRRGARQNKIYIFEGPAGSGKSTFLNNLLARFEEYSKSRPGLRYEAVWRLDRRVLGEDIPKQEGHLAEKLFRLLDGAGLQPAKREDMQPMEEGREEVTDSCPPSYLFTESHLIVPCPSHDHPILMVPKELRREFLDQLLEDGECKRRLFTRKEYEWVFKGSPCTVCLSIWQGLLNRLGGTRPALDMLCARPYAFNRRMGEGISVFNPGDLTSSREIFTNRRVEARINELLEGSLPVEYVYSRYAKTNNGIYALMDIKDKNKARLIELHNIISEGVHKVGSIEESVSSLFLALMNPEDKTEVGDIPSFSDRIEYVQIPYVLDMNTEAAIYLSVFGESVQERFLPKVLHNFARVVISTRLAPESSALKGWLDDAEKYSLYCDKNLHLLKMELYSGLIPPWLDEEDVKRFNAARRRAVIDESEHEGQKGFSGRESIKLFNAFYSTYQKDDRLITMSNLRDFFEKTLPELAKEIPDGFMEALLSWYDYSVLQQIKESLYYYNEDRIAADVMNYLFALNFEPGAKVTSQYTGEQFEVSESWLQDMEVKILGGEVSGLRRLDFRSETQREYISKALTQQMMLAGRDIRETDLFQALYDRYVHQLKGRVLEPFLNNQNFRRAVKDFGGEEFRTYDRRIRNDVSFMMDNMRENYGYTKQGAREVCLDILDRDVVAKFSG